MQLKQLDILLVEWGENKGQYEAAIKYATRSGEVKLLLDNAVSLEVLKVIGPVIVAFANKQARIFESDIDFSVQAATQPLLEAGNP